MLSQLCQLITEHNPDLVDILVGANRLLVSYVMTWWEGGVHVNYADLEQYRQS